MKLNRNKVSDNKSTMNSKGGCGCGTGVKHGASASSGEYEVEEDIEIYKNK